MNCANHPDITAAAYCRTCGKALCANCARTVRGVIYCENCLAERLEGVQPPQTAYQPFVATGAPARLQPQPGGGPHPAVAGILAGFFPFGVGAVYCGQYAKALAHLLIFVGLIWGADHGGQMEPLFGLGIAFFYVYQIIDAVRTAKAIQLGQPAPDPLGLGHALGAGDRVDTSKIPTASIVLIGLGILFLLNTTGVFNLDFNRIWPVFLIALGGWLFAQRWGYLGHQRTYDCDRCRSRGLMGPAILITVGVLSLLDSVSRIGWDRTWPLLLVVIGIVKIMHSSASTEGHIGPPNPPTGVATGEIQPPPTSEVNNG